MILTGQTAAIGTTTLWTAPVRGIYVVHVNLISQVAVAAGSLSCTIGWTDIAAARTASPATALLLTGTGESAGSRTIQCEAGSIITFATAIAGLIGSPSYTVGVSVVRL